MAITTFYPFGITFDDVGDKVFVDGVSEQGIDFGVQDIRPEIDGQVDPLAIFTGISDPTIQISTQSIAKALAEITHAGQKITSDNPLTLYCQRQSDGATRDGASSHVKALLQAGMVLPGAINAGVDAPANFDFLIIGAEDGTNAPFTITTLQSLPVETLTGPQEFFAGPAKINNVALEGVVATTINFGIAPKVLRTGANVGTAPDFVGIRRRTPSIIITMTDVAAAQAFCTNANRLTAIGSTTKVYLRKGATAGRVAAGTSEHISFTVTAGAIAVRGINGADQIAVVEILPTYDGTNAIMQIDTATAIT